MHAHRSILHTAILAILSGPVLSGISHADEDTTSRATLSKVEVVAQTPLPGGEVPLDSVAAPVQTATADEIERSHSLQLGEFMNRYLGGVYVNDVQNNPLQPDVNYRGYTASPLLGTPQGLAVYMDGIRMNQPFGDVVSWDLIPRGALESIVLLPGSNPLFGLNSLGGALSIKTKDGYSSPGLAVQGSYGSNSRKTIEFDYGDHSNSGWHWYVTGNGFGEDGWRDASTSTSGQVFGKVGWRNATTDIDFVAAYADSDLNGNGMQELRLLSSDYSSVYTLPDVTDNESLLLSLGAKHSLSESTVLSAKAYYRDLKTTTLNGDINEGSLDQAVYQPTPAEQAALAAAGYTGYPTSGESAANTPFPYWRCIANILNNDEPNEKCNGLINRTASDQKSFGLSAQLSFDGSLAGRTNRLTVGAAFDDSRSAFMQSTQFGYLLSDRSVATAAGPGAFADGTQNSEDAFDARVDLVGNTRTYSLYLSDTLSIAEHWELTASGSYYHVTLDTDDNLTPAGTQGSLAGDHSFSHFNPALGLTATLLPEVNFYFGVSRSGRAPSIIELGCADPANPCKLPNALAGDPPLDQVIATTWELGARSTAGAKLQWHAGVFHTVNSDDILFVADDQSGFGYFTNVEKTLRQGIELGISTQWSAFSIGANYTYLDATYRSDETFGATGNSTNDMALSGNRGFEGTIDVESGDRIPLLPEHTFKAFVEYRFNERFLVSMDGLAVSSKFARGNENNLHQPDGTYYLGPGETPGYAVVNLSAEYKPLPSLTIFAHVTNLFDKQYYTAAQLGPTGLRADGTFIARPFATPVIDGARPVVQSTFYSPGAPIAFSIGVNYRFGTEKN